MTAARVAAEPGMESEGCGDGRGWCANFVSVSDVFDVMRDTCSFDWAGRA